MNIKLIQVRVSINAQTNEQISLKPYLDTLPGLKTQWIGKVTDDQTISMRKQKFWPSIITSSWAAWFECAVVSFIQLSQDFFITCISSTALPREEIRLVVYIS